MNNKIRGTHVIVKYDNFEQAMRKFKKKITNMKKMDEVKEREFYEKPSETKKKKRAAAEKRQQRLHQESLTPKSLDK